MPENEKLTCLGCGSPLRPSDVECSNCGLAVAALHAEEMPASVPAAAPEPLPAAPVPPSAAPAPPPAAPPRQAAPQASRKPAAAQKKSSQNQGRQDRSKGKHTITFTTGQLVLAGIVFIAIVAAVAYIASQDGSAPVASQGAQQNAPTVDLAKLDALKQQMADNPDDASILLAYANALHDAGLIDQAIAQYRSYLEREPGNPDAGIDLGVCYFEMQDFPAAIAQMESVVAKHPDHQLGHFNLGIVNRNAGNNEKAVEWFRKAIALEPGNRVAENARTVLQEMGQTAD